jgi:hypothetical protein
VNSDIEVTDDSSGVRLSTEEVQFFSHEDCIELLLRIHHLRITSIDENVFLYLKHCGIELS